jgi:hypothetical protein
VLAAALNQPVRSKHLHHRLVQRFGPNLMKLSNQTLSSTAC